VSGAGGGTGSDRVSMSEHRIKPKNAGGAWQASLVRMSADKFTPTGSVVPGIDYSDGGMVWTPEMPRGRNCSMR
jgi:hypothetical protein